MLAIKPAAALLLIGLGGLLGINEAPQSTLSRDLFTTPTPPPPAAQAPDPLALRAQVHAAVAAQVRVDLDDDAAQVVLGHIDFQRTSIRTLEVHGDGEARLPASEPMPLDIVAVYDLVEHRLERVDYTAHPATAPATVEDESVRDALADRIGKRLAADFRDQPTRFELLSVERIDYGRKRLRLEGAGLTDFGAEGVVYTPFVAIMDKRDGELVELTYELLQETPDSVAGR